MRKTIIATLGTMVLVSPAVAVNSGAGMRGSPGTESGATQEASRTTLLEQMVVRFDVSGIAGMGGTESGPAARQPQVG